MVLTTLSSALIANCTTVQVPLYLKNSKVNSGFLAGFLNGFCYIGSAIGTYVLGKIIDTGDWSNIFVVYILISGLSLLLTIVYLIVNKINKVKIA